MVRYNNLGTYKARLLATGDKLTMERKLILLKNSKKEKIKGKRYISQKSKQTKIFHLVQFLDDKVLHVCHNNQVKPGLHAETKRVRYLNKGFFEANIIATGEKHTMTKMLSEMRKYESTTEISENISQDLEVKKMSEENLPYLSKSDNHRMQSPETETIVSPEEKNVTMTNLSSTNNIQNIKTILITNNIRIHYLM